MYILWDNNPEYYYWEMVPFLSFNSSLYTVNTTGKKNYSKNTKTEHDLQCKWII